MFVVVMYERLPTFCYTCGMIGHGSGSCAGSSSTGPSSSPLPPGVLSRSVEGRGHSPGDDDRGVQERDPCSDLPMSDVPSDNTNTMPESDFGPWMFVSRRRGRARGRGGSARASHVPSGTSAEEATMALGSSRGSDFGIRGGYARNGRGRQSFTHTTSASTFTNDLTSEHAFPVLHNPTVDLVESSHHPSIVSSTTSLAESPQAPVRLLDCSDLSGKSRKAFDGDVVSPHMLPLAFNATMTSPAPRALAPPTDLLGETPLAYIDLVPSLHLCLQETPLTKVRCL